MNVNDLTFGIELETTIPASLAGIVGGYHSGRDVAWLPAGWKAQSDGSIQAGAGRVGCEFVSPVLQGAEGIRSVLAAVAALKAQGAEVNASTGLHIHVGGFDQSTASLKKLVTLVANFEQAIYASTGTKSREQGSWCRGVQRFHSFEGAMHARRDRYKVLNLSNLDNPGRPNTVEFRAFAGSLNIVKIIGYIRLCLGLVERAMRAKRTTNWTAPAVKESSPIARDGAGQTALARLFYQLGWVKGRQAHCHGDVTCDGAPDHKAIKRELMQMAKQYDNPERRRRRR